MFSAKQYIRHPVVSDGNCGYTAFGITREQAYALLMKRIAALQAMLNLPTHQALLSSEFQHYLLEKGFITLDRYQQLINGENIKSFVSILKIKKAYLAYDVRDGRMDAGWAHPKILQALAHIQHIELHMWQCNEAGDLIPHQVGDENYATYLAENAASRTDLLFINDNHFERLEIDSDALELPSQAIAARDSPQNSHGSKRKHDNISPELSESASKPEISQNWQWVLNTVDEAQLPWLGLPVRWDATQSLQTKTAFDPATKMTFNMETKEKNYHKESPIGFITSTKNKTPMPGAQAPAAVRLTRFMDPRLQERLVEDAHGHYLLPCLVHGDYVKVEALQADHAQSKQEILKRQQELVQKLNTEPAFAEFMMGLTGIDKFFVKVEERYYGTLFFYTLYFNDINNIWLICSACNLHKRHQDIVQWLKEQWFYGPEFLDYLGQIDDQGILQKTQHQQGLAEVAINWFWERHTHYISIAQKLMQDIVTPLQILNLRVDRVVGLTRAGGSSQRMLRSMAHLGFVSDLAASMAHLKHVKMPPTSEESTHFSTDEEDHAKIESEVTLPMYIEVTEEVVGKATEMIPQLLKDKLFARAKKESIKQTERNEGLQEDGETKEESTTKRMKMGGNT